MLLLLLCIIWAPAIVREELTLSSYSGTVSGERRFELLILCTLKGEHCSQAITVFHDWHAKHSVTLQFKLIETGNLNYLSLAVFRLILRWTPNIVWFCEFAYWSMIISYLEVIVHMSTNFICRELNGLMLNISTMQSSVNLSKRYN